MRKSVKKQDPGYDPQAVWYAPFLDGKEIHHCHTADEELGKAWCHDMEPKDSLGRKIDLRFLAGFPTKVFIGKVEIKCRKS